MGQVLSTKRFGAGPFQGSIDAAISLLSGYDTNVPLKRNAYFPVDYDIRHDCVQSHLLSNKSEKNITNRESLIKDILTVFETGKLPPKNPPFKSNWVHIFPEAFVHQVYPPYRYTLRYFHWGVSRLLLESTKPPIVIPIYAYGFDDIIPEDKDPDYSLLKRLGKTALKVKIGNPLDEEKIGQYRQEWVDLVQNETNSFLDATDNDISCNEETKPLILEKNSTYNNRKQIINGDMPESLKTGPKAQKLRSQVANYLRDELENLRVSLGFERGPEEFADPFFWDKEHGGCKNVPVMGNVNKLEVHKFQDLFKLLENQEEKKENNNRSDK